ncbi:ABC transporter ATP-binding protein [Nisaea sediminum]|uniref:ABC transporter ATP-binding protein n=1 Tax=Nisaea sediminum TaxID=2775867 RepID=UPI001868DAC6|nr:ABC transporter ATP-binding protein [Nisaea sediminum]
MAQVELVGVRKTFGPVVAVEDANITFEEGSFTTLLGPSGCGKTTLLRMIAGLEFPTTGDILVGGKRVNDLPIHKRNLGLVFQNYALFPHKTIAENIGFGLKYRKVPKEDIRRKVTEALDIVRLPGVEDRFPNQLSGGQQQRIALARAIVIEPDVLLLDEPLSALDANLREEMRVELKAIQNRIGVTSIFVTHDQSEALAMSDKIVVMSAGRVEQTGSPEEVYTRPASEFVTSFLGNANLLTGTVRNIVAEVAEIEVEGLGTLFADVSGDAAPAVVDGTEVRLSIKAEKLALARDPSESTLTARIRDVDYQGQVARYFLEAGGHTLQALNQIDEHPLTAGSEVSIRIRPRDCIILPLVR